MTENRPTLEPELGPDEVLVLVDTWKRPIVVDPWSRDEAPLTASASQTPFGKEDERWRVFSGLEGEDDEEEDDEEEEEEVEDGVREEEETMLDGSGTLLDAPSVATDT